MVLLPGISGTLVMGAQARCEYLIRPSGFLSPHVKYVLVIRNASGQEFGFGFWYKRYPQHPIWFKGVSKSCTKYFPIQGFSTVTICPDWRKKDQWRCEVGYHGFCCLCSGWIQHVLCVWMPDSGAVTSTKVSFDHWMTFGPIHTCKMPLSLPSSGHCSGSYTSVG